MMSIERQYLVCSLVLAASLALIFFVAKAGQQKVDAAQKAWRRSGWTLTEQGVNPLLGSASGISARTHGDIVVEHVSESPPSPAAPFHEITGNRFPTRWRNYVRVDLGPHRLCQFQLFERAALVKRSLFSLAPVGAVWSSRWHGRILTGDARLDERFELYAEDPARARVLVAGLAAILLSAPPFGLLEVAGGELRIYVSTIAAGLVGDHGAGLAANVNALSGLIVDVASALGNV
jgi:hypothetical protein